MQDKQAPIGIFDSGTGGLTVAAAIAKHLPAERLIYFGDTAHFPYGDQSPAAICGYAVKITDFLLKQGCKLVVIACNTASSVAYEAVNEHIGGRVHPPVNVIDPVVHSVCRTPHVKNVAVIATARTIQTDVYAQRIKQVNGQLEVVSKATRSLAPVIEEGLYVNRKLMDALIEHYLSKPELEDIDGLILGCTHYPVIMNDIKRYFKQRLLPDGENTDTPQIFDSTDEVALHIKRLLKESDLLMPAMEESNTKHRFLVSDLTESFEQTAEIFFGKKIDLQEQNLWR